MGNEWMFHFQNRFWVVNSWHSQSIFKEIFPLFCLQEMNFYKKYKMFVVWHITSFKFPTENWNSCYLRFSLLSKRRKKNAIKNKKCNYLFICIEQVDFFFNYSKCLFSLTVFFLSLFLCLYSLPFASCAPFFLRVIPVLFLQQPFCSLFTFLSFHLYSWSFFSLKKMIL